MKCSLDLSVALKRMDVDVGQMSSCRERPFLTKRRQKTYNQESVFSIDVRDHRYEFHLLPDLTGVLLDLLMSEHETSGWKEQ